MIVPFLPFKIVSFSNSEHLIVFLENSEFDAIEYIKYKNGPSGEGIEVILTKKDMSQTIITNSMKIYDNLILAQKNAYLSKIEYSKREKNSLIYVDLTVISEKFNIVINFISMFPVSTYKTGIVDPKRHSNICIPFMYNLDSTVGSKCNIIINTEKIKISKSTDNILGKLNALQAYFSNNFCLSVIQAPDRNLTLTSYKDNSYLYNVNNSYNLIFKVNNNSCVLESSNYSEGYKDIIKFINKDDNIFINEYNVYFNEEEFLTAKFEPPINVLDIYENTDKNGIMIVSIAKEKGKFICKYKVTHNIINRVGEELVLGSDYTIAYHNENWSEECRKVRCECRVAINTNKKLITDYKVNFIEIN